MADKESDAKGVKKYKEAKTRAKTEQQVDQVQGRRTQQDGTRLRVRRPGQ